MLLWIHAHKHSITTFLLLIYAHKQSIMKFVSCGDIKQPTNLTSPPLSLAPSLFFLQSHFHVFRFILVPVVYGLQRSLAVVTNLDSLLKFCEWEARRPAVAGAGLIRGSTAGLTAGPVFLTLGSKVRGSTRAREWRAKTECRRDRRIIYMDSLGMHNAHEVARYLSSCYSKSGWSASQGPRRSPAPNQGRDRQ